MISLLPEMPVRNTVGPALAPTGSDPATALLAPVGEGGGSGFAALLDAALPSPGAPGLLLPGAGAGAGAGAGESAAAGGAIPGVEREPPLVSFPPAEPASQPASPMVPSLPTGRILPPTGAILPLVRLPDAAAPEALPGTVTIAPWPIPAAAENGTALSTSISNPALAPHFAAAATLAVPVEVAQAPVRAMPPGEDAQPEIGADSDSMLHTVTAVIAAQRASAPAAEGAGDGDAAPLAVTPKRTRPLAKMAPESLPGTAEPLASPALPSPGGSGLSLAVAIAPAPSPITTAGPSPSTASPPAPVLAAPLAAARPTGLPGGAGDALPPAPGQAASLPATPLPLSAETQQPAASAVLAAAGPLMADGLASPALRPAGPAPVALSQAGGVATPMPSEAPSSDTPRRTAASHPTAAPAALEPTPAADSGATTSEAKPSDTAAPSSPASSGTAPAAPALLAAAASAAPPPAPIERNDLRPAAPALPSAPDAPQQQSTIDQVGDLREALRAQRPALTLNHAEFGAVSVRLEDGGSDGWRAVLASRDPGFVPAIQAALAERAAVSASAPATDSGGNLAGQNGAFQNGTGDHRSGSSPNGGQGSPQPYLGQSGSRNGEPAPDHRRPSTTAALAARNESDDGGSAGQAVPSGGLFA